MGYIEKNLSSGEKIVYRAKLTWLFWLNAVVWAVLLGWVFGLGLLVAAILIIRQVTTEIAVTDRRIVYKRGWLFQNSTDIQLHKIESMNILQGPFARMFNYGTLEVRGSGAGTIKIPSVDEPRTLRSEIERAVSTKEPRTSTAQGDMSLSPAQ